jgi:hypothetical protein
MGEVAVRWTITCLVMSSTACFTKPERPSDSTADAAAPTTGLRVVSDRHGNSTNMSTMSYRILVPPGDALFLLVGVHAGAQCADTIPTVIQVTADAMDLARAAEVVGTPCGANAARSEHWSLAKPPVGDNVQITVVLAGPAQSLHTSAIVLDGVDLTDPVRGSATNTGRGADSSIAIDSAQGDLVIDTIGQGNTISNVGAAQQRLFIENHSADTTLDNSAASSKPGAPLVTMIWEFAQDDEWQTIATSIRPAP